jgi:ABC-2 type transport system permease protein
MPRLLEIELRKLVPSREFWLSTTAYAVLLPAVFMALGLFNVAPPGSTTGFDLYQFPDVWHNVAYVAGWVNYLLYVVVLQNVTYEYQLRTIRQNVIDGVSRLQYVAGKLLVLVVLALGSMSLVAGLAVMGGVFMAGSQDRFGMFSGIHYLGLYGLHTFGYLTLAFVIGTWVRATGLAIVVFIGYTAIAESLLRMLVLPRALGRLLPSYVLDRLVTNPFFGYFGMGAPASVDAMTIATGGFYVALFALVTALLVTRQDL